MQSFSKQAENAAGRPPAGSSRLSPLVEAPSTSPSPLLEDSSTSLSSLQESGVSVITEAPLDEPPAPIPPAAPSLPPVPETEEASEATVEQSVFANVPPRPVRE